MKKPRAGFWRKVKPSFTPSGWVYAIATVMLALLLTAMALSLPGMKQAEMQHALEQSRRVVLATGAAPAEAPEPDHPEGQDPAHSQSGPHDHDKEHGTTDAQQPHPDEPAPPKQAAAPAADEKNGSPRIAIVLIGTGLSRSTSEATYTLPREISVALTPYSSLIEELTSRYKASNREYLVEVPMEPADYPITDPGPHALLSSQALVENLSQLEWSLSRVKGAVGVASPLTEKFTESGTAVQQVIEKLSSDQLPFLASRPEAATALNDFIKAEPDVTVRVAGAVIDQQIDPASIEESLKALEAQAKKKGYAIGVGRPYPVTIQALKNWAPGLASRGVVLAPFSATTGGVVPKAPAKSEPTPAKEAAPTQPKEAPAAEKDAHAAPKHAEKDGHAHAP